MRCRDVPAGASDLSQTGGSYDGNDGSDKGRMPKNAKEEEDVRIRAVVSLILYLEVSRQRTHLIGTSLHQASRETAAGSQRNAGIKNNIYSELNTNFNLYVSKRFFTRLNLSIKICIKICKICIKICIKILTIRKKYRTFANQRCNKDEKIKGQTIINACCYC